MMIVYWPIEIMDSILF